MLAGGLADRAARPEDTTSPRSSDHDAVMLKDLAVVGSAFTNIAFALFDSYHPHPLRSFFLLW
jgi:hypothetical protein